MGRADVLGAMTQVPIGEAIRTIVGEGSETGQATIEGRNARARSKVEAIGARDREHV